MSDFQSSSQKIHTLRALLSKIIHKNVSWSLIDVLVKFWQANFNIKNFAQQFVIWKPNSNINNDFSNWM